MSGVPGPAGMLLGIALWRSRAVWRWTAALVGLASLAQVPVHDRLERIRRPRDPHRPRYTGHKVPAS